MGSYDSFLGIRKGGPNARSERALVPLEIGDKTFFWRQASTLVEAGCFSSAAKRRLTSWLAFPRVWPSLRLRTAIDPFAGSHFGERGGAQKRTPVGGEQPRKSLAPVPTLPYQIHPHCPTRLGSRSREKKFLGAEIEKSILGERRREKNALAILRLWSDFSLTPRPHPPKLLTLPYSSPLFFSPFAPSSLSLKNEH